MLDSMPGTVPDYHIQETSVGENLHVLSGKWQFTMKLSLLHFYSYVSDPQGHDL